MKHHRFFITENIADQDILTLTDRDVLHQWKRVLRFQPGQAVILLDNTGVEFHGIISELSGDKGLIKKEKLVKTEAPKLAVKLFPAMIKKDKFDWVLQKCTEIGVEAFHPIISERTEKTGFKLDRAEKIVREASEQSERSILPKIYSPLTFDEVLSKIMEEKSEKCIYIALHMDGKLLKDMSYTNLKDNTDLSDRTINIFVGPEGGWTDAELEEFKNAGVEIVSVGQPVLRAETASVVGSALLLLNT